MAFHFRQFTVEDEQSTLRVGTDAMLLGSWANPGTGQKILDIGTGCGVLALMMAQKSGASIEAIDIDQPSVLEAQNNFSNSPWPIRLSAIHDSIQSFSCTTASVYGCIITNPPFYSNSLKSPSARINQTRHDETLSLVELVRVVSFLLTPDGSFSIILPCQEAGRFELTCSEHNLYPSRRLVVFPKPSNPPKRTLLEFTRNNLAHPENSELVIRAASGAYASEYIALTECFHRF